MRRPEEEQEAHTDVSGRSQRSLQMVDTTPELNTVIALHMLSLNCKSYYKYQLLSTKLFYHKVYTSAIVRYIFSGRIMSSYFKSFKFLYLHCILW